MIKIGDLKCISDNVNLDDYITFREEVKQNMKHPEWLGDFTKEDLENLLKEKAKIWMYYLNDEFVCSMMLINSDNESLRKFNLDLDTREVVDYGPEFVMPKYVGNGLQYQMLRELDKYCLNIGFKYVIGTIHPENIYSIRNLEKDEFMNIGYHEFKRGPRNIYLKCLEDNTIQKILTFIVNDNNEFLLLKGASNDPQYHESFWYVVTGSVEKSDGSLKDAVRREVKEETNLDLEDTTRLSMVFKYDSLGMKCFEYVFVSRAKSGNIVLNEENIDYKWCDIDTFVDLIKWYGDKDDLKIILKDILK